MSRTKNLYIDEINILQLQKDEHEQYMYALGEAGGQVNFMPTKRVVIHWKGSHSAWYMCGPEVVEILESRRADIGSWYVIDHAMVQFGKDQQPPIPQESLDDLYDSLVCKLIENGFCDYLINETMNKKHSPKIKSVTDKVVPELYSLLRSCHDKTLEETVEYLFREFKYNSAHEDCGIEEGIKDVFNTILGTMQDDEMWAGNVGCLPF
jgi:hypothetical protein